MGRLGVGCTHVRARVQVVDTTGDRNDIGDGVEGKGKDERVG